MVGFFNGNDIQNEEMRVELADDSYRWFARGIGPTNRSRRTVDMFARRAGRWPRRTYHRRRLRPSSAGWPRHRCPARQRSLCAAKQLFFFFQLCTLSSHSKHFFVHNLDLCGHLSQFFLLNSFTFNYPYIQERFKL